MTDHLDVLVVGGGPVGLAAAIEARMRGLSVTVVEPRTAPIDKACGEGLMPGAVPALARLGVFPDGYPLRGVSYRNATRHSDHRFRGGEGLGVRRTVLHAAMSARALELGVRSVTGRVRSLEQGAQSVAASVVGVEPAVAAAGVGSAAPAETPAAGQAGVSTVTARYVLAADGLHSTVRGLLGVDRPVTRNRRYGLRQHFRLEPWSDLIEVHWTPSVEAYVTPVDERTVGVALLGRRGIRFDEALAGIPQLAQRLADCQAASPLKGAGPFRQRSSRHRVGRVLLVGDSSGYVDAITGEGIRVGLAQAQAAIDGIAVDDVSGYERAWRRRTRDFRVLTAGLVALAESPLRGAIVPAARAMPAVFGGIVERLAR